MPFFSDFAFLVWSCKTTGEKVKKEHVVLHRSKKVVLACQKCQKGEGEKLASLKSGNAEGKNHLCKMTFVEETAALLMRKEKEARLIFSCAHAKATFINFLFLSLSRSFHML